MFDHYICVFNVYNTSSYTLMISNFIFDKISRAVMYLKMFLGMGFVWIVEIIGGLMHPNSVHESVW